MKRPLNFFKHQVPNYEKGLQSLIQISLSILNTVFVCNYAIESSYQKRKKMYRWIHVRLFLEYSKNTQVINNVHFIKLSVVSTASYPLLYLITMLIYNIKIQFVLSGFMYYMLIRIKPKHIPNFLRRGVGIKIGIQFLSFIKSVYICTSSIDNF